MNTFHQIWPDVFTPEQAKQRIEDEKKYYHINNPQNLEEQAINLVGPTVYRTLIKDYTEKQWGRDCRDLPASIINRIPLRFTYDNNYYNDRYQGIPIGGYTQIIDKMLKGTVVKLNYNVKADEWGLKELYSYAKNIIWTGPIDEFFDYELGKLEYRSVRFDKEIEHTTNAQGVAVINFTDHACDYTRIIEHKHFEFNKISNKTVRSYEYPVQDGSGEPMYPINDDRNNKLYEGYIQLYKTRASYNDDLARTFFGGRLGSYKYMNMDECIESALELCKRF